MFKIPSWYKIKVWYIQLFTQHLCLTELNKLSQIIFSDLQLIHAVVADLSGPVSKWHVLVTCGAMRQKNKSIFPASQNVWVSYFQKKHLLQVKESSLLPFLELSSPAAVLCKCRTSSLILTLGPSLALTFSDFLSFSTQHHGLHNTLKGITGFSLKWWSWCLEYEENCRNLPAAGHDTK